jgi:hypothetical protein
MCDRLYVILAAKNGAGSFLLLSDVGMILLFGRGGGFCLMYNLYEKRRFGSRLCFRLHARKTPILMVH